jgi:site-specific DNA-cytosine methylase
VIAAEKDQRKHAWIERVHEGTVGTTSPFCMFADITACCSGVACTRHAGRCPLSFSGSKARLNTTGFSCKDLSKLKTMTGEQRDSVLRDPSTTTSSTFLGLLAVLDSLPSQCVYIGENVEELAKLHSPNRVHLLDTFREHGWVCSTRLLNAMKFGVPTARSRAWIVALHVDRLGISDEQAGTDRHL